MKILLIASVILFSILNSQGQDIYLLVKKGSVNVSNEFVNQGQLIHLKTSDFVFVNSNSLVLAKNNNSIIELSQNQNYFYKDLLKLFSPKKKSFIGSFIDIIMNQDFNIKPQVASATRGINNSRLWNYAPQDSSVVINDTLRISVGGEKSQLINDITLYMKGSIDTLRLTKTSNKHNIHLIKPGEYYWEYQLQNDGTRKKYLNYFIVPDRKIRDELLSQFEEFKQTIKIFSIEMQQQLIEEYKYSKKIYL